jgi:hypothetical protein
MKSSALFFTLSFSVVLAASGQSPKEISAAFTQIEER